MVSGVAILAVIFLAFPSEAVAAKQSQRNKISRHLDKKVWKHSPDTLVRVIVQTKSDPSSKHLSKVVGHGGVLKKKHKAVRGYSVQIRKADLDTLMDDPEVTWISEDSKVSAHLDVATKAVKGDLAYLNTNGLDGLGIGVAIVDTGVLDHADMLRIPQLVSVDIVGQGSSSSDLNGHGTHVAGIIGGNGVASSDALSFRTFRGLAPGAHIIGIRALEADGSGYTSDIIAGIDWAIQNRETHNIRVLNLSLGHPVYESYTTDPLCQAVRAATEAGIVVVVAAGNDGGIGSGYGTITSPANEPSVITVGAMDDTNTVGIEDDVLAWYSSKGPTLIDYVAKPDLVAPGTWIVSMRSPESYLDTNYHDLTLTFGDYKDDPANALLSGDYYSLAGTSMAAPMVAATVALMLQKEPALNPASVKVRLMKSATKDEMLIVDTGAGYLDVDAALRANDYAESALSPTIMLASDEGVYVQDIAHKWGSDWPSGAIWGGRKGRFLGVDLSDVPEDVTQTYGAIWGGGRAGRLSLIQNNEVTDSGMMWTDEGSMYSSTTGAVDILGAIWGGGRRGKK
jgi:serine protease AprX